MMTAGGAFYTFNDAAMKMALVDMTYGRAILVRGVMSCALLFLVAVIKWGPALLVWKNLRGQMECSFYYVLASFLFIYSLPFLSFPIAITALYTSPLFIALLAPWLLKERLNATRVISSLIGFAGVALAARSGDNSSLSWLVLLPIGSALATAMRDITLRRLVRTDNSVSILFFQQASLTLFGMAYALLEPSLGMVEPGASPYGIAVAASLGLLLGVYCTIEAFRASDVSAVSALRYASIVWAAFVGAIFWGDRFSVVQIIGMLLVIASGTLIALVERRPKFSPFEKY
jgi:drug/metabolite transporter (DMT)-like permease